MSLHHLGTTRSRYAAHHLLQTPDTFVFAPLPGMQRATAAVHAAPAMGAAFTQYTALLEAGGTLGPTLGTRFVFVLEGTVVLQAGTHYADLNAGSYALLPEGEPHNLQAETPSRLCVIEKPYIALSNTPSPALLIQTSTSIEATALTDDSAIQVQALLPGDPAVDFAVNLMTYQPGARLSQVEVHVMEHGLLMLEGEGIYRLGDSWYPVTAGDFIWMSPFCPQWFGALGSLPTRYLIYKDWNRHPLATETGKRNR